MRTLEGAATPADEVEAIMYFWRFGKGHGLIEAGAGTGKTGLLTLIARKSVDGGYRALVLAYNKAAQVELGKRGVQEAMTFHAFGRAAWEVHVGGNVEVCMNGKNRLLLHALYPPSQADDPKAKESLTYKVFRNFVEHAVKRA